MPVDLEQPATTLAFEYRPSWLAWSMPITLAAKAAIVLLLAWATFTRSTLPPDATGAREARSIP